MGIEFIKSLQALKSPALDVWFSMATVLGDASFIVPVCIATFFLDTEKGFKLSILCAATLLLNLGLKAAFDVPRPYMVDPSVFRMVEAGSSFPSGHSMAGTVFWLFVVTQFHHMRIGNLTPVCLACFDTVVSFIGVGIISQILLSRCYFGVHYLKDVIAGFLIGALVFICFRFCFGFGARTCRSLKLVKEKK